MTLESANTNQSSPLQELWHQEILKHLPGNGDKAPEITPKAGESFYDFAQRANLPESVMGEIACAVLKIPNEQSLSTYRPLPGFVQKFPIAFARQHSLVGLVSENEEWRLAFSNVSSWPLFDIVYRVLRRPLPLVHVPQDELIRVLNMAYEQQSSQPDVVLETLSQEEASARLEALETREDLLATNGQTPVVELINLILLDAVKSGASDVHFQPYREKLVVRYRIDGILFDAHSVPKQVQEEALSRVKVMGKMNIAEKRLPQDGRATVTVGDRLIDLRIASLPGNYGERIVLRLLDKSSGSFSLSEIGMRPEDDRQFKELIGLEHGLILLTGPTGSGKTTTLYAALQEINSRDRNVVTLEDPIEYEIDGISQTQINVKKGLTFASGLRNVLRQDPDIIMVGEIRDQETAIMAIQSALTGHLVFSTLHTNDAASAVTRLLDLGIEPYLVSSSLAAVLAQRLVRKVCNSCGQWQPLNAEDLTLLGSGVSEQTPQQYRSGTGCTACRQTGYRGRVAICELLVVHEPVRQKIQERASASEIRDVAIKGGMQLLRHHGLQKVAAGTTTPGEVSRVTVRGQD